MCGVYSYVCVCVCVWWLGQILLMCVERRRKNNALGVCCLAGVFPLSFLLASGTFYRMLRRTGIGLSLQLFPDSVVVRRRYARSKSATRALNNNSFGVVGKRVAHPLWQGEGPVHVCVCESRSK